MFQKLTVPGKYTGKSLNIEQVRLFRVDGHIDIVQPVYCNGQNLLIYDIKLVRTFADDTEIEAYRVKLKRYMAAIFRLFSGEVYRTNHSPIYFGYVSYICIEVWNQLVTEQRFLLFLFLLLHCSKSIF